MLTPDTPRENKPLEGEVIPRKRSRPPKAHAAAVADRPRRRRMNLTTLDGAMRESVRNYRAAAEGRISLDVADSLSLLLTRHIALLKTKVEAEQVAELAARLAALERAGQGGGAGLPGLPALAPPAGPSPPADVPPWAQEVLRGADREPER